MSKEALKCAFIAGVEHGKESGFAPTTAFDDWYDNEFMAIVPGLPAEGANRKSPTTFTPHPDQTSPMTVERERFEEKPRSIIGDNDGPWKFTKEEIEHVVSGGIIRVTIREDNDDG